MNKLNQLATDLFKELINNGYEYLTICTSTFLSYTKDNNKYDISFVNSEYKDKTPMKFTITSGSSLYVINGCTFELNGPASDPSAQGTCGVSSNPVNHFRISINCRGYDVFPFSRVETAEYLDKIDKIIARWEYDQLIKALDSIRE